MISYDICLTMRLGRQLLWTLFTLLFMLSTCLLHIFLYIFFRNIGCATLYHLSMMYVTVYNMPFNNNCRILATQLNYRFTPITRKICVAQKNVIEEKLLEIKRSIRRDIYLFQIRTGHFSR